MFCESNCVFCFQLFNHLFSILDFFKKKMCQNHTNQHKDFKKAKQIQIKWFKENEIFSFSKQTHHKKVNSFYIYFNIYIYNNVDLDYSSHHNWFQLSSFYPLIKLFKLRKKIPNIREKIVLYQSYKNKYQPPKKIKTTSGLMHA